MILPLTPAHEEAGWLECLIASYDQEHDWEADEDPSATLEMLVACRGILAELVAKLPDVPPGEPVTVADDSSIPF